MSQFRPPLERLTDDIDELVNGQTIRTALDETARRLQRKTHNVVHLPSLLDQLEAAVHGSTLGPDDVFRSVPGSKPSARLDAVDAIDRIDAESWKLARDLGSRCEGVTLRDRLRGLVGGAANHPDLQRPAATAIARWRGIARIVTGLDQPPYTPSLIPCPNTDCERKGGLRIRLNDATATCIECGNLWGPDQIQALGVYVAWAADHLVGARHWLYDAEGYPVDCLECLDVRRAMAERQVLRKQASAS